MNHQSSKERLLHIKNAIVLIRSFVSDQTESGFAKDVKTQNAVLFQFLIIGEAIKQIDDSILEKYDYPWYIPKSFRNFIAHEYHKIRIESVYRATKDLNFLEKQIDAILKDEF